MRSDSIRIATLNIWNWTGGWRERRAAITNELDGVRPDVVALQEVLNGGDLDQLAELASRGEETRYAAIGPFWEDSRYTWGVALRSIVPLVAVREYRLPSADARHARVALSAVANLREVRVRVTTTHLVYGETLASSRLAQATTLAHMLDEAPAPGLDVLCGDFNARPGSPEIEALLEHGWRDAWTTCRGDDPGYTYSLENPLVPRHAESRRIDYVLYRSSDHLPVECVRVGDAARREPGHVWLSDHFGLAVEFSRREAA